MGGVMGLGAVMALSTQKGRWRESAELGKGRRAVMHFEEEGEWRKN